MTRNLSPVLAQLSDPSIPLTHQFLGSLSDLNSQELIQLQSAWPDFTPKRRQEFLSALAEIAEEHVEFDYRSIFRWAIGDANPAIRLQAIESLWEDMSPELASVFANLLQNDPDRDVRSGAALALGNFVLWGEFGEVDQELAERATQSLWDCLHQPREHFEVRRRALEAIAPSSRPGIGQLIEAALYDGEGLMCVSALFAMGRTADARWTPFLVPELGNPEPAMRLEALRSLGELEARPAVMPIIQLIARETDLEVRLAALTALGQIGGPEARRALEAAAEWDDEATARAAEEALEELMLGDDNTFELLREVLGADDSWEDDEQPKHDWADDYEEDPVELELRRLLDEDGRG